MPRSASKENGGFRCGRVGCGFVTRKTTSRMRGLRRVDPPGLDGSSRAGWILNVTYLVAASAGSSLADIGRSACALSSSATGSTWSSCSDPHPAKSDEPIMGDRKEAEASSSDDPPLAVAVAIAILTPAAVLGGASEPRQVRRAPAPPAMVSHPCPFFPKRPQGPGGSKARCLLLRSPSGPPFPPFDVDSVLMA